MNEKILVISRHGVAPQNPNGVGSLDSLTDETVPRLYTKGWAFMPFIGQNFVYPQKSLVRHSPKARTLMTAKALMAGAYARKPVPATRADLEIFPEIDALMSKADVQVAPELDYAGIVLNMDAIKREGQEKYIRNWFANPEADSYDGMKITPGTQVMRRQHKFLFDTLAKMISAEKQFGVAVTHGAIIEGSILPLLNSARAKPSYIIDDFGGQIEMEENAHLALQGEGKDYQAKLVIKGRDFLVDFKRFMNAGANISS